MAKGFASTTDMAEKKVTFSEIGTDLYAFTAEGDPNSAVIVGDDGCLVFDAQATPAMAGKVIERVKRLTGWSPSAASRTGIPNTAAFPACSRMRRASPA